MMKKILALAVLSLALVGCGPSQGEAAYENQSNFNNPMKVGTLPDGRDVSRITVTVPGSQHKHFVYVVEGGGSTTTNTTVPQGKSSRVVTNSLLD